MFTVSSVRQQLLAPKPVNLGGICKNVAKSPQQRLINMNLEFLMDAGSSMPLFNGRAEILNPYQEKRKDVF